MTSTEKLIKKEFKFKSEDELYFLIEAKSDAFFKNNFFTDKATYLKMIKFSKLINIDGSNYSQYLEMAKSGSIMESSWTSTGVGGICVAKRKKLVNHVRFFVK